MRNKSFETDSYRFINYVQMNEEESYTVWKLRNDKVISMWMVDSEFITWESHVRFISSLIENETKDYFIIESQSGNVIGSVNIDYSNKGVSERGIFINPAYFNQNHAYKSMVEFYRYIKENFGVREIKTKVKVENKASNRLEEKLNARLVEETEEYNYYSLLL